VSAAGVGGGYGVKCFTTPCVALDRKCVIHAPRMSSTPRPASAPPPSGATTGREQVTGAEVSGRAFLGLLQHVRNTHGMPVLEDLVASAGPATQQVFAERIGKLRWYPYAAFTGFLEAADRKLPRGRGKGVAYDLGATAGQRDLGTVLKIYVAVASAERLIRSCRMVWPSYYRNAGTMEAVRWDPADTALRISDFPDMHRLHGRMMEGWMIATMESLGFVVSNGRQSAFMGEGAPYHEFRCSWTRK
jgi:hypothetical protein